MPERICASMFARASGMHAAASVFIHNMRFGFRLGFSWLISFFLRFYIGGECAHTTRMLACHVDGRSCWSRRAGLLDMGALPSSVQVCYPGLLRPAYKTLGGSAHTHLPGRPPAATQVTLVSAWNPSRIKGHPGQLLVTVASVSVAPLFGIDTPNRGTAHLKKAGGKGQRLHEPPRPR